MEGWNIGCVKFWALTDMFIVRGQLTCFLPIPDSSRFGDRSYKFYLHFSTKWVCKGRFPTVRDSEIAPTSSICIFLQNGCVKTDSQQFAIRRSLLPVLSAFYSSRFGDRSYQFYLLFSTKWVCKGRFPIVRDSEIAPTSSICFFLQNGCVKADSR